MKIEQWLYSLPLRLRAFFCPEQVDREMKEELAIHFEQQVNENIAKGMSTEEARRSAMCALGGLAQIEQQCRDARGGSLVQVLLSTSATVADNCGAAQAFLC